MTEAGYSELLTAGEVESLEAKGLRQRAKTVRAFLDVAEKLQLTETQIVPAIERIRGLDRKQLRETQKSLGELSVVFADMEIIREDGQEVDLEMTADAKGVANEEVIGESVVLTEVLVDDGNKDKTDQDQHLELGQNGGFDDKDKESAHIDPDRTSTIERAVRLVGSRAKEVSFDEMSSKDIAEVIYRMAGSPTMRQNQSGIRPDPIERIVQHIEGMVNSEIAQVSGSTTASIGQWFVGIRRKITPESLSSDDTPEVESSEPGVGPETIRRKDHIKTMPQDAIDEILRNGLDKPGIVAPREWLAAAEIRYWDVAYGAQLHKEAASELWAWIHYDEDGETPERLGDEGKEALKKLQNRFFKADKQYLNEHREQHTAARTLVITANGISRLDKICDTIRKLKGNEQMTNNIAQRHVVAAVTYLLEQDK